MALLSPMGFFSGQLWTSTNSNITEKIASLLSLIGSILESSDWPSLGQVPAPKPSGEVESARGVNKHG